MKHQFFQGFIPQQEQVRTPNTTTDLEYNLIILEISNNWEVVKELIQRFIAANGESIQVDQLENEWAQFITQNKIDINSFKNEDEFVNQYLKPLAKEETKS